MEGTAITILAEIIRTQKGKHLSDIENLDLKFCVFTQ